MPVTDEFLKHDVAVIGAGLAGLTVALTLDKSISVGIYSKGEGGGASGWAQGGLAAVVAGHDSIEDHVEDTLRAGCGLCDRRAVEEIVGQGPQTVKWLEDQGVPFSRSAQGELELGREGGHENKRIVHVSDATGAAIIDTLMPLVKRRPNVRFVAHQLAIDLTFDENGRVSGFYSLDRLSGKVTNVRAKAVVLATGGVGKAYRFTTNPEESTGDGIAMAWRAGCRIANMEFVQFHPTALFHPQARALLISEAARGEGAVLVDAKGRRFMPGFHEQAELAPRDIVARAIDSEIKRSGADCVYLDFAPIGTSDRIRERFPSIAASCAKLGIDITAGPVPVVPSAHYLCGGVVADVNGVTDVEGLHVVGETACTGLHGANRLASNSLLECVVVARGAAEKINGSLPAKHGGMAPWDDSRVGPSHEEVMVAHNWDEIRRTMWNYVGIVRSDDRLECAARRLNLISEEVDLHYSKYVVSPDFIELRNLLMCAHLIVRSSQSRKESRGLHYSLDHLDQLSEPKATTLCCDQKVGDIIGQALHAN